jgi:serine phosphatase RsbU (regulator of sigma subunit)
MHQATAAPQSPSKAFETEVTRWVSPAGSAQAGGDWCEVLALSDDVIALTVGDVAGHGESVCPIMDFIRSSVVAALPETPSPSQVLSMANALACSRDGGIIVTAIAAILDCRLRTLTIANAGHPSPLIVTSNRDAFLAPTPGDLALGIYRNHRVDERIVALPDDALIALYTDGITEHNRDALTGEQELAQACRLVYDRRDPNAAHVISERVLRNGRGNDDAAVLAVRILPAPRREGTQ